MAQGRSILQGIIKNFVDSLKPKSRSGKLIAKDFNGVEYYESEQRRSGRTRRWYVSPDPSDHVPDISPEWTAWLRHKRKHPPTEEEIQARIKKVQMYIEKGKLEKENKTETDSLKNTRAFPKYEDYSTGPDFGDEKKGPS